MTKITQMIIMIKNHLIIMNGSARNLNSEKFTLMLVVYDRLSVI